jgi:hypothetical protein
VGPRGARDRDDEPLAGRKGGGGAHGTGTLQAAEAAVVMVRAEISYFQLVYSHTWIATTPARGAMAVEQASAALDAYLDDIVSTYVKTPTLSLFVGYRFE